MTEIVIRCACGETYRAELAHAGRRIQCRCGRTLEIRPRGVKMSTLPRNGRTLRQRLRALLPFRTPDESVVGRVKVPQDRRVPRSRPLALATAAAERALPPLVWGYLGAVLLAGALLWAFGDRWWPATVLLYAGRWVLLLPFAPLFLAALLFVRRPFARRLLAPLVFAAFVCVGPIMGFEVPWRRLFGVAPPSGDRLRLVSYNAMGGQALAPRLEAVLTEWEAELVVVQECGSELSAAMSTLPGWHFHGARMLCLLSRYPIESAEIMDRSALDVTVRSGQGGSADVIRYAIRLPAGVVRVVNLHLETARRGFDALSELDVQGMRDNLMLRDGESRLARRWADGAVPTRAGGYDPPLVVAGDFNMPVESRIFRAHWGDLRNAFSEAGRGFGFTRFNGWIRVRIDHVLTDDRWRAAEAVVGRDQGSDHRPLVVELALAGAGAREGRHESREEVEKAEPAPPEAAGSGEEK